MDGKEIPVNGLYRVQSPSSGKLLKTLVRVFDASKVYESDWMFVGTVSQCASVTVSYGVVFGRGLQGRELLVSHLPKRSFLLLLDAWNSGDVGAVRSGDYVKAYLVLSLWVRR